MKTRRWAWLPCLLAVLASGCGRPDPVHQGKPLSEWIETLNTKIISEHFGAVDAIVAIGPPANPVLLARLEDVDSDIRVGTATALLRIDSVGGLKAVRPLLAHDWSHVRVSASLALIRANIEPGLAVPVLASLLHDEEYFVRSQSIKALGELGPQSTAAVPALARLLGQHADADVRWRMALGLVRIGPAAAPAVPVLIEALSDTDKEVRKWAARALGAIGPAARPAEDALRIALQDKSPEVRARARTALGEL